jgi:hypothetical protein
MEYSSNILADLADSSDPFLYLKASDAVMGMINRFSASNVEVSRYIHRELLQKTNFNPSMMGTNGFGTDKRMAVPIRVFHKDNKVCGKEVKQLVFWIATANVMGNPLAFIRKESVGHNSHKYVMVNDMKAGEMLVFWASDVYHASPILADPKRQGERVAITAGFYKF